MNEKLQSLAERQAWWMRSTMGLHDRPADPPVPGPLAAPARCDVHGIGHARSASYARFAGFLAATASVVALMAGSRPASAADPVQSGPGVANVIGASLGGLSVTGFVAGRAIERRTRYHVWLQCEAQAVTRATVDGLLTAVDAVRGRPDRTWSPDQVWISGSAITDDATSLARAHGVRCFIHQRGVTREVG